MDLYRQHVSNNNLLKHTQRLLFLISFYRWNHYSIRSKWNEKSMQNKWTFIWFRGGKLWNVMTGNQINCYLVITIEHFYNKWCCCHLVTGKQMIQPFRLRLSFLKRIPCFTECKWRIPWIPSYPSKDFRFLKCLRKNAKQIFSSAPHTNIYLYCNVLFQFPFEFLLPISGCL